MYPLEIAFLKKEALVHIANVHPSNPETIADSLGISISEAEMVVRALVADGSIKMVKEW